MLKGKVVQSSATSNPGLRTKKNYDIRIFQLFFLVICDFDNLSSGSTVNSTSDEQQLKLKIEIFFLFLQLI